MKEFLISIISLLIDHPENLKIEEIPLGDNSKEYKIHADAEDMGKIIGKKGKIIQAIRNISKIRAVKENKFIRIELAA